MGKSKRQRKKKLEGWRRRQGAIKDELELMATGASMEDHWSWNRLGQESISIYHLL